MLMYQEEEANQCPPIENRRLG